MFRCPWDVLRKIARKITDIRNISRVHHSARIGQITNIAHTRTKQDKNDLSIPSVIILFSLVVYPLILHFIWNTSTCYEVHITANQTYDSKEYNEKFYMCCTGGIVICTAIITFTMLLCFMIFVISLRCNQCDREYYEFFNISRSVIREYQYYTIRNSIGCLKNFVSLTFYFADDILNNCYHWSELARKLPFIWMICFSIPILLHTNFQFWVLLQQHKQEESNKIHDV
jgi:hypothetical protein